MTTYAMVVGRNYDPTGPHVLHCNMEATGIPFKWSRWDKPLPSDCSGLFICPGFNLPGGKYVIETKHRFLEALNLRAQIAVYSCDVELLPMWGPWMAEHGIAHTLVTNFKRSWKMWKAPTKDSIFHAYYDTSKLMAMTAARFLDPKFSVAYVGWPKDLRMRQLRKIDYRSLTLLGFGADKQNVFPAAMCEANTPWPFIGELFLKAAWHVCISDSQHAEVQSAVSRPIEAWAFGRPLAIHRTMVESRKDVDWTVVKRWIFDTAEELHRISLEAVGDGGRYDLKALEQISQEQRTALAGYYQQEPNPALKAIFA